MDNIDKVLEKLDKIVEDLTDIKVSLAMQGKDIERNADDLVEHMRRTELLENKIEPLEEHVHRWGGVGKGLVVLGILSSFILAVIKIIGAT